MKRISLLICILFLTIFCFVVSAYESSTIVKGHSHHNINVDHPSQALHIHGGKVVLQSKKLVVIENSSQDVIQIRQSDYHLVKEGDKVTFKHKNNEPCIIISVN